MQLVGSWPCAWLLARLPRCRSRTAQIVTLASPSSPTTIWRSSSKRARDWSASGAGPKPFRTMKTPCGSIRERPELAAARDAWPGPTTKFAAATTINLLPTALGTLTEREALAIYDEVLLKVQSHYVHEPQWQRLISSGQTSMQVAVTEPLFVARHLSARRSSGWRRCSAMSSRS